MKATVMADETNQLPPKVGHILRLAEIIREVDGSHDKGAAALAEAILSHPGSRWLPRSGKDYNHDQPTDHPTTGEHNGITSANGAGNAQGNI
jgi:hypothetical protein